MNTHLLIEAIENSLENAEKMHSKLNVDILEMEGMSGKKIRHFFK